MGTHSKLIVFAAAATLVGSAPPAIASWQPNGNLVSSGVASASYPQGVGDGGGGIYLSWFESPASVRVQRVHATGSIVLGWPAGGIALGVFAGRPAVARDPADGVFVAYSEAQGGGSLRVRRIGSTGALDVAWPAGGLSIASGYDADSLRMIPDGAGGAFVVWVDNSTDSNPQRGLYASRFTAAGALAPGWPLGGVLIIADGAPRMRFLRGAIADEQGGIIVYWNDRAGTIRGVRAQRLDGSGTLLWPAAGARVLVVNGGTKAPGIRSQSTPVIADGLGGAFFACAYGAFPDVGPEAPGDSVAVVRLDATGSTPVSWPATGVHFGPYGNPTLAPDGAGGVFVAWDGYDDLLNALYLRRIAADASTPAGWPASPVLIDSLGYAALAANGSGGALIGTFYRTGSWDISAAQVSATGALGSPVKSLVCGAPDFQLYSFLVPSNPGTAFVAWEDYRGSPRVDIELARIPLGSLVGVPEGASSRGGLALSSPVPNPARASITLTLHGGNATTRLAAFDPRGRLVRRLAPSGEGTRVVWNLRDHSGTRVAPGLYWIRAEAGATSATRPVVILDP